ncbi:MAG: hypothetical protein Q9M13_02765 [Mariprofundales bacterium]|nr:hypothetical protein [Mariprofundales bacterium]
MTSCEVIMAMVLLLWASSVAARDGGVVAPYPMQVKVSHKGADLVYPSVAGSFLVYDRRDKRGFAVVRVPLQQADSEGLMLRSTRRHGAIRVGVALSNGDVGYVSNRMGPISAWRRLGSSDLHQLIANGGNFIGGLSPIHLAANSRATVWALDTYLNRERRARYLDTFANANINDELLGQSWRIYWSDADHWKVGYQATERGTRNKFAHPQLFVQRDGVITMIRNAFGATISADGSRVAFVREQDGNFDLWMQSMDTGALTRLTSSRFGDFEPAFSPDGRKIAFVSNRASRGDVRHTAIYLLDLDVGSVVPVTASSRATDGGPAWSGANSIVFHSNRDPRHPQRATDSQWRLWEVQL